MNNFWNMDFNVVDALQLIIVAIGGFTIYISLALRISSNALNSRELRIRLESIEKEQAESRQLAGKLLTKFNQLETSQIRINTLLEENLKNLIKIVDRHDVDIEYLKGLSKNRI